MAKVGRPSTYTQELAKEICETIASSEYGLDKLCNANPSWPDKKTILKWIFMHPEFGHQYTLAKGRQVEAIVDQVLDIADDTSQDKIMTENGPAFDKEHINRSRLRIDTRKWLASKLAPKLYGDQAKNSQDETLTLMQRVIDKL